MKFDLSAVRPTPPDGVRVGDMYHSKGPHVASYWLVVSIRDRTAHLLGLDRDGFVVSTSDCGVRALEERTLVGRVEGLEDLQFTVSEI
jgi:hypothetical protein